MFEGRRPPSTTAATGAGPGACVALFLALLTLAAGWPVLAATPVFPELTGRVVDNAGLLNSEDKEVIEAQLRSLEETSTDQVAVVTLPSLQGFEIEDFGYQLGRHWGIGQKDKDNGALLIVAPKERKVRIEVGRRLEPQLTAAMSKLIIENSILPAFRRGNFGEGIRAGVRDIKDVLLGDADAVKERARGGLPGPGLDYVALIFLAIWLAIFIYVMYAQFKHAQQMPQTVPGRRRRRGGFPDGNVIVIPGGSSDWSGGGWSGGGGGGWSGGGGDFGGGGASGSW